MSAPQPRLQLWKEEAAILAAFAAKVPAGGTIVEIGTAEGATARLMRDAAQPGVEIYTVDIAPSDIARQGLAGVAQVVAKPSTVFAAEWAAQVGRPIDFLFIDGNHDLEHVVGDWNAWTTHVRAGGCVAFHDFDPPQRGGLAHFAVRVCGDTIVRLGRLRDVRHDFKMLHGRLDGSGPQVINAADCRDTLASIAAGVRAALAAAPPLSDTGTMDSLTVCYLAEQALHRNYPATAELATSHKDFLVWGEALQMLDHGWIGPRFPEDLPPAGASLRELSAFIAREHVRLVLLSRMVALLVERPL